MTEIDRWDEVMATAPVPAVTGVTDVTETGASRLTEIEDFLSRFVVYPDEHCRVAHTLWIAHTHLMDCWDSTPRIAFLSPEPGSGKSRALEVTEPLVPRPVHAVNTTPAYLFRKVSDPDGRPTILYDEIDTVFGPRAKDNEEVRGMLNAGHRKGAVAGRCIVRGKLVETEEIPAYCAVALAGLDDLPDTIMTRSVVVRMRRRAPGETVEPWRLRVNGAEANNLYELISEWAASIWHTVDGAWPTMPEGIEDRNADVWEPLLAIADAAGGEWPDRARVAAVTLVTDPRGKAPSIGVLLLRDLRVVFTKRNRSSLSTEELIADLIRIEESPWSDLRGREIDSRYLARHLVKYDVKPKAIRDGDRVFKGYTAAELADPWARYLDPVTAVSPSYENLGILGKGVDGCAESAPPVQPPNAVTSVTRLQGTDSQTGASGANGDTGAKPVRSLALVEPPPPEEDCPQCGGFAAALVDTPDGYVCLPCAEQVTA